MGGSGIRWLAVSVLLLLAACLPMTGCRPGAQPSILLIMVDTLRADHLGAYGAPPGASPALDSFAREAIVYEDAVSAAPFTMPAVAALLTGRYPDRVGISSHSRRDRLSDDAAPLAELARAAGYRTAAVVTNPWLANPATGFSRGFAQFVTGRSERGGGGARMTAEAVTDRALALLATYRADRPFLLWVHYMDAHMPYQPPRPYAAARGVESGTSRIIQDFVEHPDRRQSIYFEAPYAPATLEATRALYAASVGAIDAQVARLLHGLENLGRSDDTIVVFVADHGESLGDHGLYFAHDFTLYDELIAVPLMLRVPGRPAARVTTPVASTDLLPTLCALARLSCDGDLDGRVLPLTAGGDTGGAKDRLLYAAGVPARARYARNPWLTVSGVDGRWTMVRSGRSKLIRIPRPDQPAWQLYDLATDPDETSDLYGTSTTGGTNGADRLKAALDSWNVRMRRQREALAREAEPLGKSTRDELRRLGYLD